MKIASGNEKKLYLMYDQMYWHLTYGDIEHYNPVSLRPAMKCIQFILTLSVKYLLLPVFVLDWAFGPSVILAKMNAISLAYRRMESYG